MAKGIYFFGKRYCYTFSVSKFWSISIFPNNFYNLIIYLFLNNRHAPFLITFRRRFLNLDMVGMLGGVILIGVEADLCIGGCPVLLLNPPSPNCDKQNCFQTLPNNLWGGQMPLGQNHCSKVSKTTFRPQLWLWRVTWQRHASPPASYSPAVKWRTLFVPVHGVSGFGLEDKMPMSNFV